MQKKSVHVHISNVDVFLQELNGIQRMNKIYV